MSLERVQGGTAREIARGLCGSQWVPRPATSASPGNWSDAWDPLRRLSQKLEGGEGGNKPSGGFRCLLKFGKHW